MQKHLLNSDNKLLAQARPPDSVGGIDSRADNPTANNPCQCRGKMLLVRLFLPFAKPFTTVRPSRYTRPHLVGSAIALRMLNLRNLVGAAAGPSTAASARKGCLPEDPTYFPDALAD